MTQEQYKWLKDNNYDPAVYDVDAQGNIFESPLASEQNKEVMSIPRAFGTTFLSSLIPSAASLAGGAAGFKGGAALGSPFGPVGAGIGGFIGGTGGALGAGYLGGKGQQAALERFAPEAIAEMQRAETDHPIASYLGGFAPTALTFKPSFKGISGLREPLMSLEKGAMNRFTPAAVNVGVNAATSGASQLVDMSQGGEFSVPRFLADTTLGSIFSNPNALGRKMGFPSLDVPHIPAKQAMDFKELRRADIDAREDARVAREDTARTETARVAEEARVQGLTAGMTPEEIVQFKTRPEMEWWKLPESLRIDDIQKIAKQVKQRLPKGMAEELAGMPEIYDVVQNPEKFPAFLGSALEDSLNASHERSVRDRFLSVEDSAMHEKSLARRRGRNLPAETPLSDVTEAYNTYRKSVEEREEVSRRFMGPEERADIARMDETKQKLAAQKATPEYQGQQMGARREGAEAFTPEGGSRTAPEGWTPEVVKPTRAAVATEEILGRQSQAAKPVDEGISLEQALKPTPEEASKAEKIQSDNARIEVEHVASEIRKTEDLYASQALSDEAAARLQNLQARQAELIKLAQRAPSVVRKGVHEQGAPDIAQAKQELADARAIANDLYSRLQKPGDGGLMSQAELDAATQLAAQRGLRVLPATPEQQAQGIRGAYVVNENGERVIYINPFAATADTAIHEIGHDVFKTSANDRMKRSLMDTAMDSDAYKAELDARRAAVDKNGKPVHTEQQAQDFALEEGIIDAFGKNHPNVKPGEIRQWFNALKASLKSMIGMKISPDDALAWMHYATTEAVPWKGVAVGKGFVDVGGDERLQRGTDDEQVRYQRPIVDKATDAVKAGINKTLGEIDQITRRGGVFETVGRAMTRAYNTADSMLGKARSLGTTIIKLNDSATTKLTAHFYNEYRNQQRLTPAPEIAEAYKEWRTQAKAFWVDEAHKAGHKTDTGKVLRDRIESEYWFPGHLLSDEAREILSNKIGTPEYQKLKDDYLRETTADYLSQGNVMAKAQQKALVDFEEQRALVNKTFDPSAPATFAGARKPMGRPLPESWAEKDFRKSYENYNKRSAKDYAAQEHFEKSPEVMAALGSKKFFNGQDIPANILQNTEVIASDTSVQSVMREFSGQPLQMPGKVVRSLGSAASALALQTISRIGDVGGTVTKPLAYIGLGDYGEYMGGMAEKLSNWSKLKARSIESGLNNPNAHKDFHQVIGMGEDASKYMQKVLDSIGFITGSSKLESVARTLAQAQGEMIVSINKRKASTGDKDAVRFLDTLNYDWRTQSDMDLAAQFGLMMQGSYDMRQLPAWFLEGGAAPYLTWSKWSMSQLNNFRKFAVEPAMQGNLKPLIAQVFIGMAGGGAIEQVQEWLNGKESKAIKWSELESWASQNEGQIGTDGGELLLQKFMMLAQKTGTFGFAGDLAMMPINALVGDTQSSVGVFPAAELFADGMKNVAGALTAIDKGEDVGLVLQRFGKNVIVGKTQMARVASTWIDEVFNEGADNLRSSDRRTARLFEELSGTGRSNGMFPVSYENLAEQQFERSSVSETTGQEAFDLVSSARENATSPEDYASRIRKLKTSQNQIMPSLERQPMKAARYLSWQEGTEEGKGSATMKRYMIRKYEDNYRKSLIEGMSGLR